MSEATVGTTSDFFRGVNGRILGLSASGDLVDLMCECAQEACTQVMRMTRDEHDAACAAPSV